MKCFTCKTEMICYDDVNESHTRIDWVKCPKCNSTAEIQYGIHENYIEQVIWNR
jgi:hypothetical protein